MHLVFTRTPGESFRRRLRSLLLYLCDVFRARIISLARWIWNFLCNFGLGLNVCRFFVIWCTLLPQWISAAWSVIRCLHASSTRLCWRNGWSREECVLLHCRYFEASDVTLRLVTRSSFWRHFVIHFMRCSCSCQRRRIWAAELVRFKENLSSSFFVGRKMDCAILV